MFFFRNALESKKKHAPKENNKSQNLKTYVSLKKLIKILEEHTMFPEAFRYHITSDLLSVYFSRNFNKEFLIKNQVCTKGESRS